MAKAAFWTTTDAEARKCGEQTGLDTLVVHLPLLHSSMTVSKAVSGLSPKFSLLTCHTTYAPFTPSKSG